MPQSRFKKMEFTRPWVPWRSRKNPGWIVLEPARLAPLGGAVAVVLALTYYLLREWWGVPMAASDVIVRVALVFVVGYAATGIFVWYVMAVAWRELTSREPERNPEEHPGEEPRA